MATIDSLKKRSLLLTLTIMGSLSIGILFFPGVKVNNPAPTPQILSSKIAHYTLNAQKFTPQPPPLNALPTLTETEDEAFERMALIDSVITIPKLMHSLN